MRTFSRVCGCTVPLDRSNIDTDAIIPKQYLKSIKRDGYGAFLFDDWRYLDSGDLNTDPAQRRVNTQFILNDPARNDAVILLARRNFGCGSSREHAVWALLDYGIRVVIAASFSDIFASNAAKNGLLLISLAEVELAQLFTVSLAKPEWQLTVDLTQQLLLADNFSLPFTVTPELKERLLNGWDDIALTLQYADEIRKYEAQRAKTAPWLFVSQSE